MFELLGQAEVLEVLKRIEILVGLNVLMLVMIVIFSFLNILRFRKKDLKGHEKLYFSCSGMKDSIISLFSWICGIILIILTCLTVIHYLDMFPD